MVREYISCFQLGCSILRLIAVVLFYNKYTLFKINQLPSYLRVIECIVYPKILKKILSLHCQKVIGKSILRYMISRQEFVCWLWRVFFRCSGRYEAYLFKSLKPNQYKMQCIVSPNPIMLVVPIVVIVHQNSEQN